MSRRCARPPEPLPTSLAAALEIASAADAWLVQRLWSHLAVGFLGGPPKTGKSWLAIDLAVSVASATPCLGRFPVDHPGPVLCYLAEDALPQVRARIASLCAHRGLAIAALPLHVITAPALFLDDPDHRARLAVTIERIRPGLLVLDPLVRLHRRDENSSQEVSALLGFLRLLSREHRLAIVVVHHMSKKHRRDLGQSLRGSGDLHAWSDSSAYLTRHSDGVRLTIEHRAAAAPEPLQLILAAGPDGSTPHLEPAHDDANAPAPAPDIAPIRLEDRIREQLAASAGPLSRIALRHTLRVNNLRLGDALLALERSGAVLRTAAGWTAAPPARAPPPPPPADAPSPPQAPPPSSAPTTTQPTRPRQPLLPFAPS